MRSTLLVWRVHHSFIKDSKCDLHHGVICHPYLLAGSVVICLSTRVCLAMRQSHCPSSDKRSGEERGGWRGRRGKATDVTLNYCWRAERRERAEDNLFPPPRRRRLRMEFYPTCKVSLLILKRGTFKQCTSAVSCAELKIEFSRIKTGPGRRV